MKNKKIISLLILISCLALFIYYKNRESSNSREVINNSNISFFTPNAKDII